MVLFIVINLFLTDRTYQHCFLHLSLFKSLSSSKIYYYKNHQDDCIDSTQKSCESRIGRDPIEDTDHETSRLTTTDFSDFIKPNVMTVYQSYFNLTDHNLPFPPQAKLDVDHNCHNTPRKNALDSEYDQLFSRNIQININNFSIIPILKNKHDGRLKIWLCDPR